MFHSEPLWQKGKVLNMTRAELARLIRRPGETVELDLKDPVHRAWVMGLYHGEETVKTRLPALCEVMQRTIAQPPLPIPKGGDFSSGAELESIQWERNGNHLTVHAVTSLQNDAMFIDEYLEIRTAAGEGVDGYARTTNDAHHTSLNFETEFDPEKFNSDVLEIDYSVTWSRRCKRSYAGFDEQS